MLMRALFLAATAAGVNGVIIIIAIGLCAAVAGFVALLIFGQFHPLVGARTILKNINLIPATEQALWRRAVYVAYLTAIICSWLLSGYRYEPHAATFVFDKFRGTYYTAYGVRIEKPTTETQRP